MHLTWTRLRCGFSLLIIKVLKGTLFFAHLFHHAIFVSCFLSYLQCLFFIFQNLLLFCANLCMVIMWCNDSNLFKNSSFGSLPLFSICYLATKMFWTTLEMWNVWKITLTMWSKMGYSVVVSYFLPDRDQSLWGLIIIYSLLLDWVRALFLSRNIRCPAQNQLINC